MFVMELQFDDIKISSIDKEDLITIQQWINSQEDIDESFNKRPLPFEDFFERFLEYYMSDNELFLKMEKNNNIIGIFKGRVEFKKDSELIIWYFMIDKDYRKSGLGTKILNSILHYFSQNLSINYFSAVVMEGNKEGLNFWNYNGFKAIRVAKDFFQIEKEPKDMIVLQKSIS